MNLWLALIVMSNFFCLAPHVRLGLPPPYKLLMHNKSKQSAEGLAVSLPGGLKQWYSKKRVPAYTDRILWHSHPGRGNELCQTSYGAFPEVSVTERVVFS